MGEEVDPQDIVPAELSELCLGLGNHQLAVPSVEDRDHTLPVFARVVYKNRNIF